MWCGGNGRMLSDAMAKAVENVVFGHFIAPSGHSSPQRAVGFGPLRPAAYGAADFAQTLPVQIHQPLTKLL